MRKYNMVINEVDNSSPAVLRAVRVYAQFMQKISPTSPALDDMQALLSGILWPVIGQLGQVFFGL